MPTPHKFPFGVNPAELRQIVTLQKPNPVEVRDEVGERIDDFLDVETSHAKVMPLTVRDQFLAGQAQASTTHLVTMRWSPSNAVADGSWRIKFGQRVLVLDGPPKNLDEANIWMQMTCTEGLRQA